MKKNRKNLRILAVLFVVFSLLLVGNTAVFAAYENPTLTLTDFQAMPGDTFTTTLSIDEDAGIIDFQIQLDVYKRQVIGYMETRRIIKKLNFLIMRLSLI